MPCSLKCSPEINQCNSLQSPKLFPDLSSWLTGLYSFFQSCLSFMASSYKQKASLTAYTS